MRKNIDSERHFGCAVRPSRKKASNLQIGAQTIRAPRLDRSILRRECDDCDSDSCGSRRTLPEHRIESVSQPPLLVCVRCPPGWVGDGRANLCDRQLHFRPGSGGARRPRAAPTRGWLVADDPLPHSGVLLGTRKCCVHRARLYPQFP
jgi:hypothetical protein